MAWPFRVRSSAHPPRSEPGEVAARYEPIVLDESLDPKLVVHHDPQGRAAEQHRAFRTNLLATNPRREPRALLFTSAEGGAGKSVSIGNLALCLAECSDLNVCIVDADLRARGLSELFGVTDSPGLSDVLLHGKEPHRVLRPTARPNLSLLAAGTPGDRLGAALASSYLPELIAWLKRKHTYVLVDSAPVLLFSDAGELAKAVDGVLLAVAIDSTLRHEADEALLQLRIAGANVLGTFVTGVESAGDYAYDLREYEDVEA